MSGTYAAKTDVPMSRSRDEIERIVTRFGATHYGYLTEGSAVAITFEIKGIRVVMRMPLPDRSQFLRDKRGSLRSDSAVGRDVEQACRQRWRTLANAVKAKLAMVDDGISTIEREFLADVWVPGANQTYGEWAIPQIAESYQRNELPPMLPGVSSGPKVIELTEGDSA